MVGKEQLLFTEYKEFLFLKAFVCLEKGSFSETIYGAAGTGQAVGWTCVSHQTRHSTRIIPSSRRRSRPGARSDSAEAAEPTQRRMAGIQSGLTVFDALVLGYAVRSYRASDRRASGRKAPRLRAQERARKSRERTTTMLMADAR